MKTINVKTAKTAELVAFYNAHAEAASIASGESRSFRPVKKFVDRATAEKRVSALLETLEPVKTTPAERVAENRARVITVVVPVEETGKRCLARARYAMYCDGMTVGKYIKLGGKLRDVAYDLRVGFITVA